jgi:TPR repeat protein
VAYEYGEGVRKDVRTAITWYKKALAQGDIEAKKALEDLESRVVKAVT